MQIFASHLPHGESAARILKELYFPEPTCSLAPSQFNEPSKSRLRACVQCDSGGRKRHALLAAEPPQATQATASPLRRKDPSRPNIGTDWASDSARAHLYFHESSHSKCRPEGGSPGFPPANCGRTCQPQYRSCPWPCGV